MIFDGRSIDEISGDEIAKLVSEHYSERQHVELKVTVNYLDDDEKLELQNGQEVVRSANLGYWPRGSAFCSFFGPTPISREGEIRAASPVNVFGSLADDPKVFKRVKEGERIAVERTQSWLFSHCVR